MTDKSIRHQTISEIPSHVKMIMASISSYARDGLFSVDEIEKILVIALEDGEIDSDEERVLVDVLKKAKDHPFDDDVIPYIQTLRKLYL